MSDPTEVFRGLERSFPGLLQRISQQLEEWHTSGADLGPLGMYGIFLETVYEPIFKKVFSDQVTTEQRQAFFSWLDDMAESPSWDIRTFAKTEVCELIGDNPGFMQIAKQYMGPQALALFNDSQRSWGRPVL